MRKMTILAAALCLGLIGCKDDGKTITVGASPTPHAIILRWAEPEIESQGYKLKIREFDDYVLPNLALENKELDANYFQHVPYLTEFNQENGTHLQSAFPVHFEPMGIYQGRKASLADYEEGDRIAIPSDKSNGDRALELLRLNGIENPNVVEMEAQTIPMALPDVAFACINGNYALSSGVVGKCIATEPKDGETARKLANVVAVRFGDKGSPKTKAIEKALKSDAVKKKIEQEFGSSVIAL